MKITSIILHEENVYAKNGMYEYLKTYFPQFQIVSQPLHNDDLYDAILTIEFDILITDMLCRKPLFQPSQKIIDALSNSLEKRIVIFFGGPINLDYFHPKKIKPRSYRLDKNVSLHKLHILLDKICSMEKTIGYEIDQRKPFKPLSNREFCIISSLMSGMTTKEVSSELNINIKTVSTHKRNALRKLKIKSLGCLFLYK